MLFQTIWLLEPSRSGGLKADDEDGDEEEAQACTLKMSLSWDNNGYSRLKEVIKLGVNLWS